MRKMSDGNASPERLERELTCDQIGALLSYFGIDSSDDLDSFQQGVETLTQLQRA